MRRKLIITFISISFLILAVGTTTWAYVNNLYSDVSNIEITAQGDIFTEMSVDGINYSDDLNLSDLHKAIVMKYQDLKIKDNQLVNSNGKQFTNEDISEVISSMKFSPISSLDGKNMFRVNNNGQQIPVSASSGFYICFDIYFRSKVDKKYTLYFNTEAMNIDGAQSVVNIKSQSINLKNSNLDCGFNYYDKKTGDILQYNTNDDLMINAADAMRFSTEVDNVVKIYEPNLGLGSYATDLRSKDYGPYINIASRFDGTKNAQFSYINNQGKDYGVLSYENIPNSYQGFDEIESLTVTDFNYQSEVKKVTFRMWLEGYDSDCFQPIIGESIVASLSFRSTNVLDEYTINYFNDSTINSVNYLNSRLLSHIPPIPFKNGYSFQGWYKEPNYQNLFDFNEIVVLENQIRNAYAKWQLIE